MTNILAEYDKFFMDKRLGRRFATFRKAIAAMLEERDTGHIIIETGTVRQYDNWTWDGQSTRVWEWFVAQTGGQVITIDIDPAATELARKVCDSKYVTAITADSVAELHRIAAQGTLPDLVYLDSYDYNPLEGQAAAIHHLKELTAIWPVVTGRFPRAVIVMVDDYHREGASKPELVQEYFNAIGIEPLFASAHEKGGQIAWIVE